MQLWSESIIGPKLWKEFKKKNFKTPLTSRANLKSILCQNKSKLLLDSYPALNWNYNAEDRSETKQNDDQNRTPIRQYNKEIEKSICDRIMLKIT